MKMNEIMDLEWTKWTPWNPLNKVFTCARYGQLCYQGSTGSTF